MLTSPTETAHWRPGDVEMDGLAKSETVPSALVDTIAKSTSILSPSIRLAVAVQPLPPPRLNCSGVPSVNSITPKSFAPAGKREVGWLGLFEQPMQNAAIKAAPVIICEMRIKSGSLPTFFTTPRRRGLADSSFTAYIHSKSVITPKPHFYLFYHTLLLFAVNRQP